MSDPALDEARLAAIQERAGRAKSPAITGSVYVQFLSGDIDWLLAHVGVLQAENQRLRELVREAVAYFEESPEDEMARWWVVDKLRSLLAVSDGD